MNTQLNRAIMNKIAETTGKKPQPGYLRLEQLTDNAKGTYQFFIKQNSGSVLPMEKRLSENDLFVATAVRLRIKCEEPTKPGSAVYQSYENSTVFAVNAELTQEDLASIFNSYLQVVTNQTETIKAFDLSGSRIVPTTQQSSATTRSGSENADGWLELVGGLPLSGTDNIDINVVSPSYSGKLIQYVALLTKRVYVAIEFFGFLVPQGSKLGAQLSSNI